MMWTQNQGIYQFQTQLYFIHQKQPVIHAYALLNTYIVIQQLSDMPQANLQKFLPFYTTLLVLLLIALVFIVDRQTPRAVFAVLLLLYVGLLIYFYYWRHRQNNKSVTGVIHSLEGARMQNKRGTIVSGFEAQAQNILRQINNTSSPQIHTYQQQHWRLSSKTSPITCLSQIQKSSLNQYQFHQNTLTTQNLQIWREQMKMAEEQFVQNLKSEINNDQLYREVLVKFKVKYTRGGIEDVQKVVYEWLCSEAFKYSSRVVRTVYDINRILGRNFGISLTKVQSTNTRQINMDQFFKMLQYYKAKNSLPSGYKSLLISAPIADYSRSVQFGINIHSNNKNNESNRLDNDLQQLLNLKHIIEPMLYFPSQKFNSCFLVYLLKEQFGEECIEINGSESARSRIINQSSGYGGYNFVNSNRSSPQQIYSFIVQYDYWITLSLVPEFRTKNCLKICLIFLLILLKKEKNYRSQLMRDLRKICY